MAGKTPLHEFQTRPVVPRGEMRPIFPAARKSDSRPVRRRGYPYRPRLGTHTVRRIALVEEVPELTTILSYALPQDKETSSRTLETWYNERTKGGFSLNVEAYPLRLEPLLVERPWGGTLLTQIFSEAPRRGNGKNPVGEAWVLSDHPSHASRIVSGPLAGRTLREFVRDFPHAAFGACASPGPDGRFPLLVKFIEAAADLSVQVHPDDAYALEHEGDLGKSEAWYFLRTNTAGTVIAGHRFPDRETYFRAVREGQVRDYLLTASVRPKTFLYIPAGTVHILLADTVVVEIQEASDVTYRIYDWDRIDPATGKARELHVEKAADVLRFEAAGTVPDVREGDVDTPYFFATRFALPRGERLSLVPAARRCPLVLIGVEGEADVEAEGAPVERELLREGTTVLLPATLEETTVFARKDTEFLLVEPKTPTRGA